MKLVKTDQHDSKQQRKVTGTNRKRKNDVRMRGITNEEETWKCAMKF